MHFYMFKGIQSEHVISIIKASANLSIPAPIDKQLWNFDNILIITLFISTR